jgi:hypothetical protein
MYNNNNYYYLYNCLVYKQRWTAVTHWTEAQSLNNHAACHSMPQHAAALPLTSSAQVSLVQQPLNLPRLFQSVEGTQSRRCHCLPSVRLSVLFEQRTASVWMGWKPSRIPPTRFCKGEVLFRAVSPTEPGLSQNAILPVDVAAKLMLPF